MKIFSCYKEIWFGIALGAVAWVIDAAMHVKLGAEVHAEGFWTEVFTPHPTAIVFRLFYMVIAVAFGTFLWRANWRERQLEALEQAVIAFQRQLDSPALRILSAARDLHNQNTVRLDLTSRRLAAGMHADAVLIDELAKRYIEFGRLVQAGETARAIETLRSIERWLAESKLGTGQ